MAKRQEDYTIDNVIRHLPKFIKDTLELDTNQLTNVQANLVYINNIASSMGYDKIMAKSFVNTFTKPLYNYSKGDINQTLANIIAEDIDKVNQLVNSDDQLGVLKSFLEHKDFKVDTTELQVKIDTRNHSLQSKQRQIDDRLSIIERFLGEMHTYRNEIEEFRKQQEAAGNGIVQKVVSQIEEVIASKKWLYLGTGEDDSRFVQRRTRRQGITENGVITRHNNGSELGKRHCEGHLFLSTSPIICTHINRTSKRVTRASFGHVLISMSSRNGYVPTMARFVLNSICSAGSAQHPHINSSGSVCWGSFNRSVSNGNTTMLQNMDMFLSLLETYSPDNPYEPLTSFTDAKVAKRHACLLSPKLYELLPTKFVESVLTVEQRLEYLQTTDVVEWFDRDKTTTEEPEPTTEEPEPTEYRLTVPHRFRNNIPRTTEEQELTEEHTSGEE
jgi:hypothetical protein